MKRFVLTIPLAALISWSTFAHAQEEPAKAPDVMITLDGALVTNSSSNIGPAIRQIIGDHNDAGPCHATNDWATCDALRFGLSVHAGPGCDDDDPLTVMYDPGEDVGIDFVGPRLSGISGEDSGMSPTYCARRNHDTAQTAVWEATFPGTTAASDPQLDLYWERPHLQLFVTDGLPSNPTDGSDDDRVIKTLNQLCQMHAAPNGLPSMPTWVMVERRDNDPEVLYGGLAAAAGGTGECEELRGGTWTPIDVCEHIGQAGVDENYIRAGIASGTYRCGGGPESFSVGQMDYADASGNQGLGVIKCHLDVDAGPNCASRATTDLFPLLSCVRQLPRGVSHLDANILDCCAPASSSTGGNVATFSVGPSHGCAILEGGTAMCWGEDADGLLGDGTEDGSATPVGVINITNFQAIGANRDYTCGLTSDGAVYCWGIERECNFGDDNNDDYYTSPTAPTQNINGGAVQVATGHQHACALMDDGSVVCWGDDSTGQLGNGSPYAGSCSPVTVSNVTDAKQVSAGRDHGCAVDGDNRGWCWGYNGDGQLGDNSFNNRAAPAAVHGGREWTKIKACFDQTCGITVDGDPFCWGNNLEGQLGDGSTERRRRPVAVAGLSDVVDIDCGEDHACAVTGGGEVYCWGNNNEGQVTGNSAGPSNYYTPRLVAQVENAIAIGTGQAASCALESNGDLICWGLEYDIDDVFLGGVATNGGASTGGGGGDGSCQTVSEGNGIEWIDANKTMFHVTGKDSCDSCIQISLCKEGIPCDTGLDGRCAAGATDCSTGTEECVSVFAGYPEICNGLDDDCDGKIDNISESWAKPQFANYVLPDDHVGQNCNLLDVCMCPGGVTDTHSGTTYDDFLDSWSAVCMCGEGLEGPQSTLPDSDLDTFDNQATCEAVSGNSLPASFLALLVLAFVVLIPRARRR